MQPSKRLLIVAFSVVTIASLASFSVLQLATVHNFNLHQVQPLKKTKSLQQTFKPSVGIPAQIAISKINVNAKIGYIGLTTAGALDTPNNVTDVGWYKSGPLPGNPGSPQR